MINFALHFECLPFLIAVSNPWNCFYLPQNSGFTHPSTHSPNNHNNRNKHSNHIALKIKISKITITTLKAQITINFTAIFEIGLNQSCSTLKLFPLFFFFETYQTDCNFSLSLCINKNSLPQSGNLLRPVLIAELFRAQLLRKKFKRSSVIPYLIIDISQLIFS
jgi:hypothetical protein